MAFQELDENGHSTRVDDDLSLLCRAGRDVGQRPCCLELYQCMRRAQEFDEPADDACIDDTLDGRVALL